MTKAYRVGAQAIVWTMALVLLSASSSIAADAVLYRIFLRDGTTLVSYGEFARVAGRVVLSVPIGDTARTPHLELVSIPESSVDWGSTDRYTEAARARRYAETRGEDDFTLLSAQVARVLNEAALTPDPARRLAMLAEARRALSEWPAKNYWYRAADVAQLSSTIDEVMSELRIAAGESQFDLSFVGSTLPPPTADLLPAPSVRDTIEEAFTAAKTTPDVGERVSLLRAIAASLREQPSDASWAPALYRRASLDLEAELKIEKTYAEVARRALSDADHRARDADVRGVEGVIARVLKRDDSLGRVRPQETAALLASLDSRLDAARRLRLARDAWQARSEVLRAYRTSISHTLDTLRRSRTWLEDIRHLAGPNARSLDELQRRLAGSARELELLKPPSELEPAHDLLAASVRTARQAATTRQMAVASGMMETAWDASAAAAGALMLLDRALADVNRVTSLPQLR
jgi:hypothetical protein